MPFNNYLNDDKKLRLNSVDDYGDSRYMSLHQNVPDGYVYDLQSDLLKLGFEEVGNPDGAFGRKTGNAVRAFQGLSKIQEAGSVEPGVVDRKTKDEIILWLEHDFSKDNPPTSSQPNSPIINGGSRMITPRVPHFSQGDSRWSDRVLGRDSTIKRKGCAITCIAMILRHYGRSVTPGSLDDFLDRENGYSGDSVIWGIADRCEEQGGAGLKYKSKEAGEQELNSIISERVSRNLPTMVRVDYGADHDIRYNHFVLAVGETDDGNFVMNDPATRLGDGYASLTDDNIIQKTSRNNGYRIVKLDWYERG